LSFSKQLSQEVAGDIANEKSKINNPSISIPVPRLDLRLLVCFAAALLMMRSEWHSLAQFLDLFLGGQFEILD
jgi:hypothetical protein